MFEQAFKNIDDVLRKEAGCASELDYTEQTSWLLFLKYLDSLEQDKAMEAALEGRQYRFILDEPYRWESWAAPKTADGKLDHNQALTGDDLRDFVDGKLFPYLHGFKQRADGPNTIEYKIGEIFAEIKNRIHSGYNLREIIDHIDELRFRSQTEKHELSHLYEAKIKNMGNAGRNGGEYYTPRPLIRAIVQVVQPKIGERIYDGAVGSAGFLCEAFDYLTSQGNLTTTDLQTLQTRTFYGKEKKSLAYVIAIMNMILHGIEAPNIAHTNTLAENLADLQDKDRVDVILANPPFGGKERKEVQQNFAIRTGETAFLFLQHFIKMLKAGGRAGVVIKNTFLSNTDNASVSLRKLLLETCNLHTVLDCPGGTFQGAGVKTVVLFFEKGAPTRKVWYYQLDPGRNMGKTNPLNDADLAEFVELQKSFADSPKSWVLDAAGIDQFTFDLSVKNPNAGGAIIHRNPQAIMDEIAELDAISTEMLRRIQELSDNHFKGVFSQLRDGWIEKPLGDVCDLLNGFAFKSEDSLTESDTQLVRMGNLYGNILDLERSPVFYPNRFAEEYRRYVLSEGDIIISLTGTTGKEDYGYAVRIPECDHTLLMNQRIAKLDSIRDDLVNSDYLLHYLHSRVFLDALYATANGTRQANLSSATIKTLPIPLYSIEKQKMIAVLLDQLSDEIQRLESLYQQKVAALDELKKSLLHQAFSGNL